MTNSIWPGVKAFLRCPWAAVVLAGVSLSAGIARGEDLADGFHNPPASARPQAWWHWMNGNISASGITADLEAMHHIGLAGFEQFDVSNGIPAGPVSYMSDEWFAFIRQAASEADRLGLRMCISNAAGWSSSGGPWIAPEQSMREIVWSTTQVAGGQALDVALAQPESRRDYYKDVAVIAFPTLKGDAGGKDGFRIKNWTWKIDRNVTSGRSTNAPIVRDTRTPPEGDVIQHQDIVVLTDHMDGQGHLKWDAPAGNWTVLRFGQTTTGRTNHTGAHGGVGLECDKLNRDIVKFQWDHSVQRVIDALGPLSGRVFNNVLIDSYEAKLQNWTTGLDRTFAKRMGYDLITYLPCLTGRVVDNVDTSERFLWDFRRVIADLMAENYFGYFHELCHDHGLLFSNEPYNLGGFDYFQVATLSDIPMGELWTKRPDAWHQWSNKLASSAAHAMGRKVTGAEAFTAGPPASEWTTSPYNLKTTGDRMLEDGVNRIIFHTQVHQPWPADVVPGMTMGPHGIQMNRNNTWYSQSGPWIDHWARAQYVLQQGTFVADLCYVASEDVPQAPNNRNELSPVPPDGYDYDMIYSGLVMQMSVKDGRLVLPSGMSYRVLVLPDNDRMRPALLEKIKELVDAGATVYGTKRVIGSPSLQDQPAADEKVQKLAGELWEGKRINAGKTLAEVLTEKGIQPDFIAKANSGNEPLEIRALHRQVGQDEIYFVANQQEKAVSADCTFRAGGRVELWYPETGRVVTQTAHAPAGKEQTTVPLYLEPAESVFVVFHSGTDDAASIATFSREKQPVTQQASPVAELTNDGKNLQAWRDGDYAVTTVAGKTATARVEELPAPTEIAGPWELAFPEGWGAPAKLELSKLISWTDHELPDVKHFSGTATYDVKFDAPADQLGQGKLAMLDLGDIEVLAHVTLNGKDLGVLWKPPFRADVTGLLKAGENQLTVQITNLWRNRLIGDSAYPATQGDFVTDKKGTHVTKIPDWLIKGTPRPTSQRRTFATWQIFKPEDPLSPSGLIGPVRIIWGRQVPLHP